jgi:hypothetical protein
MEYWPFLFDIFYCRQYHDIVAKNFTDIIVMYVIYLIFGHSLMIYLNKGVTTITILKEPLETCKKSTLFIFYEYEMFFFQPWRFKRRGIGNVGWRTRQRTETPRKGDANKSEAIIFPLPTDGADFGERSPYSTGRGAATPAAPAQQSPRRKLGIKSTSAPPPTREECTCCKRAWANVCRIAMAIVRSR